MDKPESVQENKKYRILWDFNIQTDYLIPIRRPDLEKRNCNLVNFTIPVDYKVKIKENKKTDKYMDLAWELKKLWNIDLMMICSWFARNGPQKFGKKTVGTGNQR